MWVRIPPTLREEGRKAFFGEFQPISTPTVCVGGNIHLRFCLSFHLSLCGGIRQTRRIQNPLLERAYRFDSGQGYVKG